MASRRAELHNERRMQPDAVPCSFQLSFQNTEFSSPCEPNEAVLDPPQPAGFKVPFSCRKGVCGPCKGRVISGEVRAFAVDALGTAERAEGQVLFCSARP